MQLPPAVLSGMVLSKKLTPLFTDTGKLVRSCPERGLLKTLSSALSRRATNQRPYAVSGGCAPSRARQGLPSANLQVR